LQSKGCKIVDATCPDVKRVQDKAKDLASSGYRVVIIGRYDHPEVIAIKAHADLCSEKEALVISNQQEAHSHAEEIKSAQKVGIVIQTTQRTENFKEILPIIEEYSKELKVFNTICSATHKRQQAAKDLACEVDLMIVVGSKSSANTTHLAEILNPMVKTIHIDTQEELDLYQDIIINAKTIGVTAGASTPEYVIQQVITKISE